jgi:hypothetical protein
LRPGAFGKRGGIDASLGKGAREFLTPVRYFTAGGITVNETHGSVTDICELVEGERRNIANLSTFNLTDLLVNTQLAFAFENEIHFFLLVIVPGYLSAARVEGYVTHTKVGSFNGQATSNHSLSMTFSRVTTPCDIP